MDSISIRDLEVNCIIGTREEERTTPQKVIFNLELFLDLAVAGRSDNLADSVNYQEIEQRVKQLATTSSFFLLEKLAEESAAICLEDPRVKRVRLTIDKPGALANSRSAAVTIVREQKSGITAATDNG